MPGCVQILHLNGNHISFAMDPDSDVTLKDQITFNPIA